MSETSVYPKVSTEPVGALLRALDVEAIGEDRFTGASLPQLRRQVFGGQVLAQAIIAASRTLPEAARAGGAVPSSVQARFIRPALTDHDLRFHVIRSRDGHTVTSRRVEVSQEGKVVLEVAVSLSIPHPGGLAYSHPMPDVARPEVLRDSIEIFQATGHPVAKFLGRTVAFSLRHVDGSVYVSLPKTDPTSHDVWVRPRAPIPDPPPALTHALLAYVSDQIMLEPALRTLGLTWSTPHLRAATLDHAVWFHRPFDINDWHLFHLESPTSAAGRSLARGLVFNPAGEVVASLAQEGLVHVAKADSTWQIAPPSRA